MEEKSRGQKDSNSQISSGPSDAKCCSEASSAVQVSKTTLV